MYYILLSGNVPLAGGRRMAMNGFPRADRKIPSILEEVRLRDLEEHEVEQELDELDRCMDDWHDEDEYLGSPFAVRTHPTLDDLMEVEGFYDY